jgi:hypothetical protein
MTFLTKAISVSMLGISAMVFPAMAKDGAGATAPAYNPATVVNVMGTVSAIRQVPGNDAMAGVHLTVKAKTGTFDVVVGPAAFLKLTRTNFASGEYVEVQGSLVNGNTVLSREVYGDDATLTLRDAAGTPVWEQWGL